MSVAPVPLRAPSVLLVVGNGILGGMETAVLRLARSVPAAAFELTALVPYEGAYASALRSAGVTVALAPMSGDPHWSAVQAAVDLVRSRRVDLVHAHLTPAHLLAAIVGRVARVPVVATVHAMHMSMPDLEAHRLGGTHLCFVSEAARTHGIGVGAAPERVRVIRNAVDASVFAPADEAARVSGADGPPKPALVGWVGRLSQEKHPVLFVRIAARVREVVSTARFVMLGDGPLRPEVEAAVADAGLEDAFDLLGNCDDMPRAYRSLDVMVSTSWHEGTPLAVLEAMASAVTVVASDTGGVRELVAHDVTGRLFPVGDEALAAAHVIGVLADTKLRAGFSRAARERVVERFAWPAHVAAVTAMWRELAGVARRRGTRARVSPADDDAMRASSA